METVYFRFREDKKCGLIGIEAKNDLNYYKKHAYHMVDGIFCTEGSACMSCRYINFMERNNLIKSGNSFGLSALKHKIAYSGWRWPPGFDHTTQWRRKHDRWPLFVLTEPYYISENNRVEWDLICQEHGFEYRLFEKSQQSLWFPDETYMVFWYHPKFWEFEPGLMEHIDAKELDKLLIKQVRETK